MRYSLIREMDISNGSGVGISLFVQGCHFHCKGCFNKETWDFNGGLEWNSDIKNKFIELANKNYIKRISILGGEPLAKENVEEVVSIILALKNKYPEKQIWLYTGYLWENIINSSDKYDIFRQTALFHADVVVDGQFQLENQDIYNKEIIWAGSTNQRVIDSKESFNQNKVVLYGES